MKDKLLAVYKKAPPLVWIGLGLVVIVGVYGAIAGQQRRESAHCNRPLIVSSDPRADYCEIDRGGTADHPTLTSRRVGPSGTSYSIREFDCTNRTWKYLGTGDTLDEAQSGKGAGWASNLVDGSIEASLFRQTCP